MKFFLDTYAMREYLRRNTAYGGRYRDVEVLQQYPICLGKPSGGSSKPPDLQSVVAHSE